MLQGIRAIEAEQKRTRAEERRSKASRASEQ